MLDRMPTPGKENRVKITQDDGTVIEGVMEYADGAVQQGSAYIKGNVLPDDVCGLLSIDSVTSEPKDAFVRLGLVNAEVYGGIMISLVGDGSAVDGVTFTLGGSVYTTDDRGRAFITKPAGNYTALFSNTLDLTFVPSSLKVESVKGQIRSYTVQATASPENQKIITQSTIVALSSRVADFDIFCVGGGGSGAAVALMDINSRYYEYRAGATGGAGGRTSTKTGIKNSGQAVQIVIGAGGSRVTASLSGTMVSQDQAVSGNSGGETYASIGGSKVCSALGGAGGKVGADRESRGIYLNGSDGGSGSGCVYADSTINQTVGATNSGADGANGLDYGSVKGGVGQGTTTKPFEETGTSYSPAGAGCALQSNGKTVDGSPGANGGSSKSSVSSGTTSIATASIGTVGGAGGGAALAAIRNTASIGSASVWAESSAGVSGLAIIRWRYAS